MHRMLFAALLLMITQSGSIAETIAHCGKSIGKEYAEGNGWTEVDGTNYPETTIVEANSAYDILFRDPLGVQSVTGQNGKVYRIGGADDRSLTLLAVYPLGSVETYQLTLNQSGRGKLFWTNLKHFNLVNGQPIGGIYVADCSR